eukprot:c16772_g1_i3.p1 GENE.c16772_g1_i3~~c16772_g1_i3.p1  ORF type:complete len:168 (+),score=68.37 c16772_g1_i3:24-506(+)
MTQTNDEEDQNISTISHTLESPWTLYYDKKEFHKTDGDWDSHLKPIGTFDTVENFWSYYNHISKPSMISFGANLHLFKHPIKPMWEDEANENGGKWILNLKTKKDLIDVYWENLVLALIGEVLDDGNEITGAVLSKRKAGDKIAVWNRNRNDSDVVFEIG